MKRLEKNTILFFLLLITKTVYSQDVTNNYINFDNLTLDYHRNISPLGTNYNGELVISADLLPFGNNAGISYPANSISIYDLDITWEVEVVSFPFSLECTYTNSCNDNSLIRNMKMPYDNTYQTSINDGSSYWIYNVSDPTLYENRLFNKTIQYPFENAANGSRMSDQHNQTTLISAGFHLLGQGNSGIPVNGDNRMMLPHTILKHIIKIYYGAYSLGNLISSFSFYTDLTRGKMREYPFYPINNSVNSTPELHDLIIAPGIINGNSDYSGASLCDQFYDTTVGYTCDGTPNRKGDAINYTPWNINQADQSFLPQAIRVNSNSDLSFFTNYDQGPNIWSCSNVWRFAIPDRSLVIHTDVLNNNGDGPAGYRKSGNTYQSIVSSPQAVLEFEIDKTIDLSKISQNDYTIFNPSEVNITAPLLRFPSNYTFKTIRGRYPFLPDYIEQNTIANGGAYNTTDPFDPNYVSQLAVITDLGKDWHNTNPLFPDNDPLYSSIYYLKNGSKLIIEPCVRIFDATFVSEPGSEIIFEDFSTNQINVNRYQILFNGGKVTKQKGQYLFQDVIWDKRILNFNAENEILVGRNVDPSTTLGNVIVQSNSQVNLKASNFIDLSEGFNTNGGAEFSALIDNIMLPPCVNRPQRLAKTLKDTASNISKKESRIVVFPNPITEISEISYSLNDDSFVSINVYTETGQLVTNLVNLSNQKSGIYFLYINSERYLPGFYLIQMISKSGINFARFIK